MAIKGHSLIHGYSEDLLFLIIQIKKLRLEKLSLVLCPLQWIAGVWNWKKQTNPLLISVCHKDTGEFNYFPVFISANLTAKNH